jgi:HPt (histidine-containing phosphotransfer) domain-containing protein
MIIYENGKIVAISKKLLNYLDIPLEKISEVINKIELEMAVLNQNSIELFNIIFKIKKEEILTLKNIEIFILEKIEKTKLPETQSIDNLINSQTISTSKEIETPLINNDELLNISIEETPQSTEILKISTEEEEEKPIELNFNDNITECEKIFEKKDKIIETINKELELAAEDLGIDLQMTKELFEDLLNQIKNKKDELYKTINNKDYEAIHKIAHYLKGACLNLRLSNLAFIFKTIDEESKNQTPIEKIKSLTDKLYDYINPLYNNENNNEEIKNINKIEIDPKIKKFVINTIRYYLETQDEKKFQQDKKYIEKLLNTQINSLHDLEEILKES